MAQHAEPNSEGKYTYDGHCHCGVVKFRCSLSSPLYAPPSDPSAKRYVVNKCNCSICQRNAYLLVYPVTEDLQFTEGKDKLSEYLYATKQKPHLFCKECGSSIMIDQTRWTRTDGTKGYAVNVDTSARMLRGVNPDTLQYEIGDGWNELGPHYPLAES